MSADFAWEDPPERPSGDVYATRWFTTKARDALTGRPGAWGRIARDAGNHVHLELRRRYPLYEFVAVKQDGTPRRYTIYARRRGGRKP